MVIMWPLMPIRQMINDNKYKLQFRVIGESPALKPSSKAPFKKLFVLKARVFASAQSKFF